MKIGRILSVAGILTLLACGAAFTQSPPIPVGAGVGIDRQPPGSSFRDLTTNPPLAGAPPSATNPDKRAVSLSCSQQADAKGLQGRGREAFRSRCEFEKAKAQ